VLSKIQSYETELFKNPEGFFPACCPICQESGALRKHEFRARGFWAILAQRVHRVQSLVLRLACKICKFRTTVLPEFALPHKRYVVDAAVDHSERYLLDETATYESATEVGGTPTFHDPESGSFLARSTVHRWIGFFGSLVVLAANATELALEANPAFSPLTELLPIAPRRYRSQGRRETLERAHRLLGVRRRLLEVIDQDFFPRVATETAWT